MELETKLAEAEKEVHFGGKNVVNTCNTVHVRDVEASLPTL